MPRNVVLLLGALLIGVLTVAFWPNAGAPELRGQQAMVSAEEELRSEADAGEVLVHSELEVSSAEVLEQVEPAPVREEVVTEGLASESSDPETQAWVTATVVNADGAPLEGATLGVLEIPLIDDDNMSSLQPIFLAIQGSELPEGAKVSEALTGADGKARLASPADVQVVVYARHPRHLIAFTLYPLVPAGEEHDVGELKLHPGGWLEVSVLDETGQAIEDAGVVLTLVEGRKAAPNELPIQYLPTQSDGRAIFQYLSFAEYKLEVAKHGFQHQRISPIAITRQGDGRQQITLSRGGTIQGVVVDALGVPQPDLKVAWRAESSKNRPEGFTQGLLGAGPDIVTDAAGRFAIEGVFEDGLYNLTCWPKRGLPAVDRKAKAGVEVTLELPETAFVRGRVLLPDGGPAEGARIGMQRESENGRSRSRPDTKTVNPDGTFEHWLRPGSYYWFANHPVGEKRSYQLTQFRGEIELGDIELDAGADAVLTYVTPAGKRIERIDLDDIILVGEETAPSGVRQSRERMAQENGAKLTLRGLPAGNYKIEARARNWLAPIVELSLQSGDSIDRDIVVAPAARFRMSVFNEAGEPFSGSLSMEIRNPPQEWKHLRQSFRVRVNDGQTDWINGVIPGEWSIRQSRSKNRATVSLTAGEQQIECTLLPPSS